MTNGVFCGKKTDTMVLKGKAKHDYMRDYMRRYRAKKGDSVKLAQKQGLENAPESTTIDEQPLVRPRKTL